MKVIPSSNPYPALSFDLPKLFQKLGRETLLVDWPIEQLSTSYSKAEHALGELHAETSGEKVVISGKLFLHWEGPCRRCLEATIGTLEMDITEVYEDEATEGETFKIPTTEILDLEPMLSEHILLSLPLAPLCSSDCLGPMPQEFPANTGHDVAPEVGIDPRWEALGNITFDENDAS
jgi:uncharacterized protein